MSSFKANSWILALTSSAAMYAYTLFMFNPEILDVTPTSCLYRLLSRPPWNGVSVSRKDWKELELRMLGNLTRACRMFCSCFSRSWTTDWCWLFKYFSGSGGIARH